ncbi:MAG: uncharacterized protein QOE70_3609 [Chthoniobacter sp.]|jgi:rSAM/selenodomain-associated transferase 2|nr:uncharacterized protein [Chthoniobacter sp.]
MFLNLGCRRQHDFATANDLLEGLLDWYSKTAAESGRMRSKSRLFPQAQRRRSDSALESGSVSIIIPVWRESAASLEIVRAAAEWPEVREIIISAAEDHGSFGEAAEAAGACWISSSAPNRGRQLNLGARLAHGEWLLFQHADTELTRAHVQALAALTCRAEIVGGAFYRHFDARHPHCRWMEPIERWHNRTFGALYGDQSLFVRREHFAALGGFADIPLMEDVEFSRRLRRSGPLALLDPPIASSPRKHLAQGAWKTTVQNAALILLYKLGVPPARLHAWYYGPRETASIPSPNLIEAHEE